MFTLLSRTYNGLEELGYNNFTINNSKYFKDPEFGKHTKNTEGTLNAIK